MTAKGAFTFILHSHIPYARLAGRWPHGEEWIHEAATETYIPLLNLFNKLAEDGINFKVTLGLTPVLVEQLQDADILEHLSEYLDTRIQAASDDMELFLSSDNPDKAHLEYLAGWHKNWYENIRASFHDKYHQDIIGAFRQLQDDDYIEIMTSAATHAYLPLIGHDSSIYAQLHTGISTYQQAFGKRPTSIWLPECGYRPGMETFLDDEGIQVFFSETHAITGGQPVGIATGDALGPYNEIKRRYAIELSSAIPPRPATTFRPYYIAGLTENIRSGVAVIGRNHDTGQQVWSAEIGYPGDFDYREFHKKAYSSGLPYWRVTDVETQLDEKDYYHPDWAQIKIEQHAEHFVHLVSDEIRHYAEKNSDFGIVASMYDTELFGHWWFEGIDWLENVLRFLADDPDIELTTASSFVHNHPPESALHLPESSWGVGGKHFTWNNNATSWIWDAVHNAESRMEALAAQFDQVSEDDETVLRQAGRELLLMQSSDWAFLITTGQAREYASQRFRQHHDRFNILATSLENGSPDVQSAEQFWELDKVFPDLDFRWFAPYHTPTQENT